MAMLLLTLQPILQIIERIPYSTVSLAVPEVNVAIGMARLAFESPGYISKCR